MYLGTINKSVVVVAVVEAAAAVMMFIVIKLKAELYLSQSISLTEYSETFTFSS
jgi:hypothetical protein